MPKNLQPLSVQVSIRAEMALTDFKEKEPLLMGKKINYTYKTILFLFRTLYRPIFTTVLVFVFQKFCFIFFEGPQNNNR